MSLAPNTKKPRSVFGGRPPRLPEPYVSVLTTGHWLRYLFGRMLGSLHPKAENDREREYF
jgi:hypothetical protein